MRCTLPESPDDRWQRFLTIISRPRPYSHYLVWALWIIISILVFYTKGNTQQIMYILYGAPVMYATIICGLPAGLFLASSAVVVLTVGRSGILLQQIVEQQWLSLFFEVFLCPCSTCFFVWSWPS